MKKTLYSFFVLLLISNLSLAQCLSDGITFSSQQQIDDFASDYPGCSEIEGYVTIDDASYGDITNLNGLSQLTSIIGEFRIQNNSELDDLSGLDNLVSTGDYFRIINNGSLTDLTGLGSLTSTGLSLIIWSNNSLTSLDGLNTYSTSGLSLSIYDNNSLTDITNLQTVNSVEGNLEISHNNSITSLEGLENISSINQILFIVSNPLLPDLTGLGLTSIGKYVKIEDNAALTSLSGLDNLTTIGEYLFIVNNPSLNDMSGLEALTSIGGHLEIENNGVSNLNGLDALTSIGGYLSIHGNSSLTSLSGIQNIDPNTIESQTSDYNDLELKYNASLSECEVLSICSFLDLPDKSKSIYSNMTGCDSELEVQNACGIAPIPDCTALTNPINGSTDVDITTDLSWESSTYANGYKLTVGTTSGGTDIEDNTDVGNVTTYDPGDFPCGSEIFVTITPYNNTGDASGCDEESFTTESVTADAGDDEEICESESTQLEATGGTVYSWSPTDGLDDPNIPDPIASPSTTTTYTVTVSNDNGCSDTDQVTVAVNPSPIPNASATDETANDANDGTATCAPTGGTPSYSYEWSNNETTQTITGLEPGNYTVTVTDIYSCSDQETVSVAEYVCPTLTVVSDYSNPSCYQECDGVINIYSVTNGIPPFSYLWSNGETTSMINNLCEDVYTVTVTDSKNCTAVEEFEIVAPYKLIANASATDETANNANDGTATCAPTGGTLPYEYEWSNGEITQTIENLAPGYYYLTVSDEFSCEANDTVFVAESTCPDLTVSAQKEDNYCFGACEGSIEIIDVINGNPPFNYSWSNGEESSKITDLCSGEYSVTIVDSDNCQIIEYFEILSPSELLANATSTDETANNANNGTATANPTGGTSPYYYKWSTGDTSKTITGLSTGDYIVTVSDLFSCTSIDTAIVSTSNCNDVKAHISIVNLKCFDSCLGSITIDSISKGNPPFKYLWSTGDTISHIDSLCSGKYFLTITDITNCETIDSFIVSQPKKINANIIITNETAKDSNDGTASSNPSGGIPPYTFKWSNGSTTNKISNLIPGIYTLTVSDANGCNIVETANISKFGCTDLVLNIEQDNISCFGECDGSLNAVINKSIVITEIMYNSPDENDLYEYIELYNVSKDTVQMKDYEFIDGIEHKFDSFNLAPNTFLLLVKDSTLIKEIGISGIIWDNGGLKNKGETIILINSKGEIIDFVDYDDKNEWVSEPDGNGPSLELCDFNKDNSNAIYWKASTNSFGFTNEGKELFGTPGKSNSINCNQVSILEENQFFSDSKYKYTWNTGDTTSFIKNLCSGIYSVTVVDENNCNVIDTFEIIEPLELLMNLSSTDETALNSNDGTISINPTGGISPYDYLWSNGETTQTITNLSPGLYQITVTDANGCSAIDSALIATFSCPTLEVISNYTNISCFDACDGTIEISNITNSVSPLSYKWDSGETSSSLNNLCAGDFTVTVTDAKNCQVINNYNLTQPNEITLTIDSTRDVRINPLGYIAISTNNNGNYTFSWFGPNNYLSFDEDIYNLGAYGCYTVTITDTLTNCSIDSTICLDDKTSTFDLNYLSSKINLYPNPTKGNFIIDFSEIDLKNVQIKLLDLTGKQKQSINSIRKKQIMIDTKNLNSGLYIIQINTESQGIFYKKIIVNK